jgi:hypothetical protein
MDSEEMLESLKIDQKIRKSEVDSAIQTLEKALASEPIDRFKSLIGKQFRNSPSSILRSLNKFIRDFDERGKLRAVYLEMNGFFINFDKWFFDFFGYSTYNDDPDDLVWLSDWQWENGPITLTGLEKIQRDFEWYHTSEIWKREEKFDNGHSLAVLLVMVKFVALIKAAVESGPLAKPIPILATAHEFDTIGRFLPT